MRVKSGAGKQSSIKCFFNAHTVNYGHPTYGASEQMPQTQGNENSLALNTLTCTSNANTRVTIINPAQRTRRAG